MTLVSGIATYAIIWWLTLFVVLPFGIVTQEEVGDIEEGSAPSAPVRPQIVRKLLITTAASAVVFAGVFLAFGTERYRSRRSSVRPHVRRRILVPRLISKIPVGQLTNPFHAGVPFDRRIGPDQRVAIHAAG